jgi:hypothetical protein
MVRLCLSYHEKIKWNFHPKLHLILKLFLKLKKKKYVAKNWTKFEILIPTKLLDKFLFEVQMSLGVFKLEEKIKVLTMYLKRTETRWYLN